MSNGEVELAINKLREVKTREGAKKVVKDLVRNLPRGTTTSSRLAVQPLITILSLLTPREDPSIWGSVQPDWRETHYQDLQVGDRVEVLNFLEEQERLPSQLTPGEFMSLLELFSGSRTFGGGEKQMAVFQKFFPCCLPPCSYTDAVALMRRIPRNARTLHSQLVTALLSRKEVKDNDDKTLSSSDMLFFLKHVHLENHVIVRMSLKLAQELTAEDLTQISDLFKNDRHTFRELVDRACDAKKVAPMMESEWLQIGSGQQVAQWKQRLKGTYVDPMTKQLNDPTSLMYQLFNQRPLKEAKADGKRKCEKCKGEPAAVRQEPCMHLICRQCVKGPVCPVCCSNVDSRVALSCIE
jgi:hypothetical protein